MATVSPETGPVEQKIISTDDFVEILKSDKTNAIEVGGVKY